MLIESDLNIYYNTNFRMIEQLGIGLNDIENMIPFEYDIYVNLVIEMLKAKEEAQKSLNN